MSIKVALEHRTTYRFDRPIEIGPHVVRLRPAPHTRTPIEAYSLTIKPENHFLNWQQDPFGNYLARVVFPQKSDVLDITVGLVADMEVVNPFDFFIEDYAETFPFSYPDALRADLEPYLAPVEDAPGLGLGPVLSAWLDKLPLGDPGPSGAGQPTVDFLVALNAAVYGDVAYSVRMEHGVQSPDETLTRAIGSCRDSAWLLVAALRHFGLAARFVSGYLVQLTADQPRRWKARAVRGRTSPTCTPGPRCSSPVPAGSGWTRPRPCSPARVTSPWRRRRTRATRPRSAAPPSRPRWSSSSPTPSPGSPRTRGSPSRTRRTG